MDPFLKKFFPNVYRRMKEDKKISNYCKFDSQLLTLFTSSLYLSGLVSAFFAASVTRVSGRKASMLVAGVAVLIGSALGGAASNLYMLVFGRLFLGIGLGFGNQVLQSTLSYIYILNFFAHHFIISSYYAKSCRKQQVRWQIYFLNSKKMLQ